MDSIISRFKKISINDPNRSAISWKNTVCSYQQLATKAAAIQQTLKAHNIQKGDRVGIALKRGPDIVSVILGILASGGSYVPLDPNYPADRLKFMMEDSSCRIIISDDVQTTQQSINIANIPKSSDLELIVEPPADIAYIIYTSGSTGVPKGVEVKQASVIALLDWAVNLWSLSDLSCVLAGTSICFDISVFELLAPLTSGGEVLIVNNVLELVDHPQRERVTLINTVPSAMTQILRVMKLPSSVKSVCIAGEPFPRALAKALVNYQLRVFNLYGPTEDTIFSTFHQVKSGDSAIPIGKTIRGTQAHILTEDGKPTLNGEEGELYLSGAGVARGYLNRPELTKEKFITTIDDPKLTLYRTGDIVCLGEDGLLYYKGRYDQQVKIRGYRIELDEIKIAIENLPEVFEASVNIISDHNEDPKIVAWVCPEEVSSDNILSHLKSILPDFMLPSDIVSMTSIPRLPNGKLDRNALKQPSKRKTALCPPKNQLEIKVTEILSSVLGVKPIGRDDRFSELGGTSLNAVSVVARIRQDLNKNLKLSEFLAASTVASIAALIEQLTDSEYFLPELTTTQSSQMATPIQKQMWVIDRLEPNRLDYLTAMVIELDCNISLNSIIEATTTVVYRHSSLHCTITPELTIKPETNNKLPYKILPSTEQPIKMVEEALKQDALTPIHLEKEIPLRAIFAQDDIQLRVVGLLIHHIAIDGWSLEIFLRELTQTLAAQLGAAPNLKPLTIDLPNYAAWLHNRAVIKHLESQCHKRIKALKNAPMSLSWPQQNSLNSNGHNSYDCSYQLISKINHFAKEFNTTAFVIEMATFAEALCQHLGIDQIIIGTAAAVRPHPELEKVIGCFTNLVPLHLRRQSNLHEAIKSTHQEVYNALDCSEVPFAKLVDKLSAKRTVDHAPLVQVAFGVESAIKPVTHAGITGRARELHLGHTRLDLTAWLSDPYTSKTDSKMSWTWRGDKLNEQTVKNIHNCWISLLEKGIADPSAPWVPKRRFSSRISRRPIGERLVENFPGQDGVTWIYQVKSVRGSIKDYISQNRASIRQRFAQQGAILIRGFQSGPAEELAQIVDLLFQQRVSYGERSSPRSDVASGVYTSTNHPSNQPIVLHNEQSYTLNWPLRILFRCDIPAEQGGATPIADMRAVLKALDPDIVRRFAELGVTYQRNYAKGIGVSWQTAFQTEDKNLVAQYCHQNQINFEWLSNDHLRTTQIRPALRRHPESNELLFFNHALFFHVSSLLPEIASGLQMSLNSKALPTQTYWGNGQEFEPEVLDSLRDALVKNTVRFSWQAGDLLILDNMKIAHGRDPYAGARKVIVAMADPVTQLYGKQTANPNFIL